MEHINLARCDGVVDGSRTKDLDPMIAVNQDMLQMLGVLALHEAAYRPAVVVGVANGEMVLGLRLSGLEKQCRGGA